VREATDRQLWIDSAQGDIAARERLVHLHLPLAKRIASSLYARRPGNQVEFGDYLQLAYVGLIEAVERYDVSADAQFSTFATYRIRGSILDGVPKMTESGDRISFLQRQRRERVRSWIEPSEKPAREGVGGLLDMVIGIALTVQIEEIAETHSMEPTPAIDPYASRAYEDMQRRLRDVIGRLAGRERQVVDLHYFHHMGFEDIGRSLGVTKGRVSQIHKCALESVRAALHEGRLTELL
jgi:RNA polymerase sigma factor FliA